MPSPTLEAIWAELRLHVQWAEGFAPIFLFAGHPYPVDTVFIRLEDALRLSSIRPLRLAPASPDEAMGLVDAILAQRPVGDNARPPIWVELWRHGTDPDWREKRHELLIRLNERRYRLEQEVRRPLILVLPDQDKAVLPGIAPDLWAVRVATYSLPSPAPDSREYKITEVGRLEVPIQISVATPSEAEWARQYQASRDPGRISVQDGLAAVEAAMARGAIQEAARIAEQTLGVARQALLPGKTDESNARRALSAVLDALGNVKRDLGDLEAARSAYAESLDLHRQLRAAQGDSPQALRDLSVSLEGVGHVSRDLGDLEAARSAYAESLDLRRQLRAALGDTPGGLDDLARSLGHYGLLQLDLHDAAAARAAFQEGSDLAARLVALQPDHPGYRKLQAQFQADLDKLNQPDSNPT